MIKQGGTMNNRRIKRSKLIMASICLLVFMSLNCSQQANKNGSAESTLTIYFDGDERALGPNWVWPWYLVFLTLSIEDEAGNDLPRLMERWEHTPDYKDWMIYLRKDVKWNDGVPVTAADVKFSLKLWQHPDILWEEPLFEMMTVIDDHTLQIKFKEADRYKITYYNYQAMLPKHLLENHVPSEIFDWEFWTQPVGNGPYRYVRHLPKTMIELEVNPTYYQDKPKIGTVILRFGGNHITELRSGNVDIVPDITPREAVMLGQDPRFRVYHENDFWRSATILWNHRNPLFSDSEVRKALTLAINRRELQQVLNYPDSIPIYDVPLTKRHFLQGQVPEALPYDPERAKILLEKAGWIDLNNDGIREKDDTSFRFTLATSVKLATEAVYIQDQYQRIGIQMEISTFEENFLLHFIDEVKDFDAALLNNYFNHFPRMFLAMGYENPESHRLYGNAVQTLDWDEMYKYLRELWPIYRIDVPVTYLHPYIEFRAAHKRVKGLGNQSHSDPFRRIEYLWIEDED